jgi:hypothetical protein
VTCRDHDDRPTLADLGRDCAAEIADQHGAFSRIEVDCHVGGQRAASRRGARAMKVLRSPKNALALSAARV